MYKTGDNMTISRKGTLSIRMKSENSAKKLAASGAGKSKSGISQLIGGNATSFKINDDGDIF